MTSYGSPDGLRIEVTWKQDAPKGTADEATAGWLQLSVGGVAVWGAPPGADEPGLAWTWVDLFEHLARVWSRLTWEQRDPVGLDTELPNLRRAAHDRWDRDGLGDRDAEEVRLWSFLEAHDLAAGLGGIAATPVYFLREGATMRVWFRDQIHVLSLDDVLGTLRSFGAAVQARLSTIQDGRAAAAIKAWKKREATESELLVRLATGLAPAALKTLSGKKAANEFFELDIKPVDNPLLAVARMTAGRVPLRTVALLLKLVKRSYDAGKKPPAAFEQLSVGARAHLAEMTDAPAYDEGLALARWLRQKIGAGEHRVDPSAVLAKWGVIVNEVELASAELEAAAVWEPSHAPNIFVNMKGKRSSHELGRRATLAHEMAHLLVDRSGALPLAEVLGGRAPARPESRANAFAAELLVPRSVAARELAATENPRGTVSRLSRRFGASSEIIAWQALRAGVPLAPETREYLVELLPADKRYQVAL